MQSPPIETITLNIFWFHVLVGECGVAEVILSRDHRYDPRPTTWRNDERPADIHLNQPPSTDRGRCRRLRRPRLVSRECPGQHGERSDPYRGVHPSGADVQRQPEARL